MPMAVALTWVSRITTVSVLMVLPGVVGYWLDGRFGTRVLFTLLGFALGMLLGMWQLIQMTRPRRGVRGARKNGEPPGNGDG